jgi:predicted ATPase/class 3 adenylate cyclase
MMAEEAARFSGVATFLFTDIEQSTGLWERHGERMRPVLARHDALLRAAVEENGGKVVKTTGDGLLSVFGTVAAAVLAALAAQRRLANETWAEIAPDVVRVRMGLHSGEAQHRDGDYYGTVVNRAARIMSLGHGGQVLLSAVTVALIEDVLPPQASLRDLGEHALRGLTRDERIYQLVAPGLESDFPPLRSTGTQAGNLPAHVSSFIGRAREMSEVRMALTQTRLLTLTGPGGTGKTRLSLQVAADLQNRYEHGAWVADLAPVTDPALVVTVVANLFGIGGQSGAQTRQMLLDYLREKVLLLVLDNCEHLIEACAQLAAELIATCPQVTILASSREGLGVYGETTYHLPTMSLPALNILDLEAIAMSEAVQLFVERAAAARPGFKLSEENAGAVAQVVRRLDGIPLAIELAAARLKFFTVEQVAARLDDRFRLLTGGSRTALPRQQTLRALIDWSYDLLDGDERDFFQRLAVFMGGWTFEAAESVADPLDAYSLLPQLVAKSLVTWEAGQDANHGPEAGDGAEPRYFYLETIRQYARDRLVESGMVEEARDRHFAFYERLAKEIGLGAGPTPSTLRADLLRLEHDNLRTAVEWGIDRHPQRVLNLLWNLAPLLADQFPGVEAVELLTAALNRLDTLAPEGADAVRWEESRYRGLAAGAMVLLFLGQLDEAMRVATEIRNHFRPGEWDPLILAFARYIQVQAGYFLEDPMLDANLDETTALLEGLPAGPTRSLLLSMVQLLVAETASRRGDIEEAQRNLQASVERLPKIAEYYGPVADYTRMMVMVAMDVDPAQVRAHRDIAVSRLQQSGSRRTVAMVESDWAHFLRKNGEPDEALALYENMLVEWRDLGHRAAVANILENIAFVDRAQGRPQRAATLFGAAERLREEIAQDMLRPEREEYERELAALRDDLAPQELERLWANGRTMSLDAVIDLARKKGAASV